MIDKPWVEKNTEPSTRNSTLDADDVLELLDAWGGLRAEANLVKGAMAAADERLHAAAMRAWGEDIWGCDAADHLTDAVLGLRAEREALTDAVLGLRAERGRLHSALRTMVDKTAWAGEVWKQANGWYEASLALESGGKNAL